MYIGFWVPWVALLHWPSESELVLRAAENMAAVVDHRQSPEGLHHVSFCTCSLIIHTVQMVCDRWFVAQMFEWIAFELLWHQERTQRFEFFLLTLRLIFLSFPFLSSCREILTLSQNNWNKGLALSSWQHFSNCVLCLSESQGGHSHEAVRHETTRIYHNELHDVAWMWYDAQIEDAFWSNLHQSHLEHVTQIAIEL